MVDVEIISSSLIGIYNLILSKLPAFTENFINLFLLVILVVLYAIFIWKVYKFISKKNILGLNLNKYNKSSHPFLTKLLAGTLYFAEYIVILPFVIFFWFAVFTLFLILLTDNLELQTILIISATIVAAIRMTSYYKEELSRDLAKLLPFTLLAISLLNPKFFDIERIIGNIVQIPAFLSNIFYYLMFIIILEIILRLFDFLFSLFGIEEDKKIKKAQGESETEDAEAEETEETENNQ